MSALRLSFLAAVVAATPVIGSAQQPQDVPLSSVVGVGSRVRLKSTLVGGRVQGIVAAVDEKALTLSRQDGPPITVPLSSITALDMSTSRKRNTLKGLGIGVLSGVLVGLVVPVNSSGSCNSYASSASFDICSRGEAVAYGALSGAAYGAVIGALIKSDRWSPVTLNPNRSGADPRLSLAPVLPRGGGVGLRVAVNF